MRYLDDDVPPERIQQARQHRNAPTWTESKMWELLRNRRLGVKFRRQWPIGTSAIVDFYCIEARLAIEVDGAVHLEPAQAERDAGKDFELAARGVRILRFTNDQVVFRAAEVEEQIRQALAEAPGGPPTPRRGN